MKHKQIKKLLTKKFLINKYILNKFSSSKISKIIGCSNITIINYLKKFNIKIRDNHECHKGYKVSLRIKKYLSKFFKGSGNPNFGNGEKIKGINNPFFGKHHTEETKKLIGNKSKGRKSFLGKKHTEIAKKKMSETRIRLRLSEGKSNGRYIHGLAYEPYSNKFNDTLKESIRKRDNYECQKCGIKQKTYRRKLDIHHIDYNKQNCKEDNLITTCNRCNAQVNSNRDYWYTYFTHLMEK